MSINKNHIRFVIKLIGVLIIASLAVTGDAVPSLSNSGGGSWQYQRDITISNIGGTLSDYQVLVSLTSGNFPTNAQNSGADIRFTDASGAELSYWIENWDYYSRTAKIWVKVTSIASGSTTIRMYYGNPSATSVSNGGGTFMLFDDFSGASVNSGLWTTEVVNSASLSQSGGELTMTVGATQQGNRAHIKSNSNFAVPFRLRFKAKLSGYGDHFTHSYDGTTDATWSPPHVQAGQNFIMYFLDRGGDPDSAYNNANGIGTSTYITTGTANVYSLFEILATTSEVKFVVDDTLKATHTTNIPTIALPLYFRLVTEGGAPWTPSGATQWMDYVFLAKYASPEPTLTLGAEQTISPPATTGTITVSTNLADSTFTITGALTYSGSGTAWSTTNAPAGTYTITYGAVIGYNTPPSETKTLTAGGSVTFSGTYNIQSDIVKPIISISYPSTGLSFTTNIITVSGTAFDDVGLSKIEVKVGAGSWQLASGTTSWSKEVTLSSGSNTIYARATDTSGKTAEDSVTAVYVTPTTSATVSLSGISSSYNAGDTLSATVYVTNTGGSSHTFPVGFSVKDPNGNWNDIPYKTVTLNLGSSSYVYFTYNIPSSGPAGTWTVRTSVWDRDAGEGDLQTRYDYKEQTVSISMQPTPTPTPTPTTPTPTPPIPTKKENVLKITPLKMEPNQKFGLEFEIKNINPSAYVFISEDDYNRLKDFNSISQDLKINQIKISATPYDITKFTDVEKKRLKATGDFALALSCHFIPSCDRGISGILIPPGKNIIFSLDVSTPTKDSQVTLILEYYYVNTDATDVSGEQKFMVELWNDEVKYHTGTSGIDRLKSELERSSVRETYKLKAKGGGILDKILDILKSIFR
jgi:hypothetical protein